MTGMVPLRISVVVPTLGRPCLKDTLAALDCQTYAAHQILPITDKERRGASWARNTGITQCTGEIIAFIDDDCIPPPNWLESIVDIFNRENADVVGGYFRETDPLLAEIQKSKRGTMPTTVKLDTHEQVGSGGNIAFTKRLLEQTFSTHGHIFSEALCSGEDRELMWRLLACGARVFFNPVEVVHLRRAGFFSHIKAQFPRGIGIRGLEQLRNLYPHIETHPSLLWDGPPATRWIRLLFYKVLGPFNWNDFSSFPRFATHWCGQKAEGLGYLYALLRPGVITPRAIRKRHSAR